METKPEETRQEAVEAFAAELTTLRSAAGNPSFRAMAGRSGCISHTTLHEAVRGNRLPTWETTVEFVKSCGGDPAEFQARWQEAAATSGANTRTNLVTNTATQPSLPSPPAATHSPTTVPSAGPQSADETAPAAAPESEPGPSSREPAKKRWLILAVALLALGLAIAAGVFFLNRDDPADAAGITAGGHSTVCPIKRVTPKAAEAATPGDSSEFIGDITMPDCSAVAPGQRFTKIWRLKNTGSLTWHGRTLHRLQPARGAQDCRSKRSVPVPDAKPGQTVDIRVDVIAPEQATYCAVQWVMRDENNNRAFPGRRPINFQVIVGSPTQS